MPGCAARRQRAARGAGPPLAVMHSVQQRRGGRPGPGAAPSTDLHPPRPAGKTRGMGAGRKLRLHRKDERWADKDYKKSHLGSEWKKPFAGASHAKGIVLEKM